MTKGRDNAAESMKDVLALIRSRKQSGVLSVERFENGVFEEGEIQFQTGRPVQSVVGKLSGDVALQYMSTWRRVYFAFLAESTLPPPPASKQTPAPPLPPTTLTSPPPTVRLAPRQAGPITPLPSTQPTTGRLQDDEQRRIPDSKSTRGTNPTDTTSPTTGPLMHQSTYDVKNLIPYKLSLQADVMSLSLSRLQRSVYLLVDGQRSVADLARFTGKKIPEILQTLVELRARNLVSM